VEGGFQVVGIGPKALTFSLESAVLAARTLDAALPKIGLAAVVEALLGPVAHVGAGKRREVGHQKRGAGVLTVTD